MQTCTKHLLLSIVAMAFIATAYCQTHTIDSLRKMVYSSTDVKQKTASVFAYLNEYESLPTDSFLHYYNNALTLLENNFTEEKNLELNIVKTRLLRRQNKVEEAILLSDSLYNRYGAKNINPVLYRRLVSIKSGLLISQQKYKEALDLNFATLKKAEQENNEISQVFCQITVGWIYMELAKNREALNWFFTAIDHTKKIGYTEKIATVYANIAAVYGELKMTDSAEFFIQKAFYYSSSNENLTELANCYYIFSDVMVARKNIPAAEEAMNKGVEIRRKIADPFYYVSDLYQLAIFYANNNEPQKGINTSLNAIKYAQQNNLPGRYIILYDALAKNYKAAGNDKMYSATLEKIIELKDSLYKNNSAQSLADLRTKYEVQKQENKSLKQQSEIVIKNYLLYGSLLLFILLALLAFTNFRNYRKKQSLKMELAMQHEKEQVELAVRDAEEKERVRIAAELHDNIGVQASAILYGTELLQNNANGNKSIVNNLHNTAKEMMVNLRETLWAMKNTDVEIGELWIRVINFCKQMEKHYTHIKFTVNGGAPEQVIINSPQALNILMIIQEAANNAAKHAVANDITVSSVIDNNKWVVTIKDNGKGFNMAEGIKKNDCYGLTKMQERANNENISLLINTEKDTGTTVTLSLKL